MLSLGALLGLPGLSSTARAATPETFYAINDSFAFTGHGYGHGRGMSQYGAYAAASSGLSAAQILDFYYQGSVSSPTLDSNAVMRVLISGGDGVSTQVSPQTRDGVLSITDANTGTSFALPLAVGANSVASWRLVAVGNGSIALQGFWAGGWQAYPVGAGLSSTGAIAFSSSTSLLTQTRPDGTYRDYGGALAAAPNGATGIYTINLVPTETYLRGVVPSEASSSWPAAALEAQSIAARTYAVKVSSPTRLWDICDTTSCQVYSGLATFGLDGRLSRAATATTTDAAINATAGQIRTYAGQPILAQYSASNGGWTVSGGPSYPYLVAKADPYDGLIPNSANTWTQTIDAYSLGADFGVGRAYALTVTARDGNGDWGGRVQTVTVAGSAGSVTVSGSTFEANTGMKSDWWTAPAGTLAGSSRQNGTGTGDLVAMALTGTGTGTVEIHGLTKASQFSAFGLHSGTAFGASDPADWRFFIAPYNGDGQADLYGVQLRNTGSGKVEVHVLSAASGYKTFLLHVATGMGALPPGYGVDVALGSYNGDGKQDLYFVMWGATGSGKVEVHTLGQASTYQSFLGHAATALGTAGIVPGDLTFLVGDAAGRGDLIAVVGSGSTGSGRTEVHVLSQSSGYTAWTRHVATAIGLAPRGEASFQLGDYDQNGTPDLYAILRGSATATHLTEVHVMSGADAYQSFLTHAATGLGQTPASAWQFAVG